MSSQFSPMKNRRYRLPSNPWIPYVGDCKAVDNFLNSKGRLWVVPKFLNAFFRGISQVMFVNNPLSGLIILLSLFWSDLTVGLATTVAASAAIITALLMRQDLSSIRAGLTTYNAVLVGCVTASLWFPIYAEQLTPRIWIFIIAGAVLSVFVTSGLANILSSLKLPCLTLPFNVVNILLFLCLMPAISPTSGPSAPAAVIALQNLALDSSSSSTLPELAELKRTIRQIEDTAEKEILDATTLNPLNEELEKATEKIEQPEEKSSPSKAGGLDWGKIFTGIICSMGQVFAVENLLGSILIYVAVMIYSPILCLMCILGAGLGTISGLLFTGPDYTTIYAGIWGYNGILSAAAVGGFFIAMTCHSFWTAVANVLFTVLLQHALALTFTSMRLPVFTLPFVLSTLLFLSVSSAEDLLPRVTNISFPEMHRYEYLEGLKIKKLIRERAAAEAEQQAGEEKELVLKDVKVILDENEPQETIKN